MGDGKQTFSIHKNKRIIFKYATVCRILDEGIDIVQQDNQVLMHDLKWMLQTAWNLGLFCFSSGRNDEGTRLFDVINKVSSYHIYNQ
jgi:hypothetical protein